MTDKQLVERTQWRLRNLQKLGLENDVSHTMENTIDMIWGKGHKKGFTMQDIPKEDRRIARQALNQFLKNPMSLQSGIKREFAKAMYNGATPPDNITPQTMVEVIQTHDRYMNLSKAKDKYGYAIESKARKNLNKRKGVKAKEHNALSELIIELSNQKGFSKMTGDQKYNQLLREMRKRGI